MIRVGLTGNIASGKSSVARVWRRLGAHVIEADLLAREAVAPGSPGLRRVVEVFGPEVIDSEGRLDRAALREIVFRDPEARARLEAITHPEIARLREEEEARLAAAGVDLIVNDVPLLFEVGMEDAFDVVVLVDAPEEVRLERLIRDRGLSEAEARRMIEAQMPSDLKRPKSDIVIENTGSLQELEARAEEVWQRLRERAAGSA